MKRISSTIMALCLACGIAAPASASSFSINGYTMMMGQMSNNLSDFTEGKDAWNHFDVNQRIAVEFEWIASERLNAKLDARIPQDGMWGNNQDFNTGNYFNLYEAYFSWVIPVIDVEFKGGQQYFVLPGYMGTASNPVYDDHQTGFAFKKQFSDSLGLNVNFIRMENAIARTFGAVEVNTLLAVNATKDVFTLELPVTTSILDVTPWAAVGLIEEGRTIESAYAGEIEFSKYTTAVNLKLNANKDGTESDKATDLTYYVGTGALSPVGSEEKNQIAYFAGLTTSLNLIDNFKFGVDVLVTGSTMTTAKDFIPVATGSKVNDNFGNHVLTYTNEVEEFNVSYNHGILADAHLSYDLTFMTIGLNGWYATGDKIDLTTGKENIEYGSILSLNGSWGNEKTAYFANGGLLNNSGVSTPAGTMGGGLTLTANPMQKLNVGFNAMYLMGTHEYINTAGDSVSFGSVNLLTANDNLIDLGASLSYDIYDNFQVNAGGNYIIPTYDGIDTENGFVLGLGVNYIF